MAENNNNLSFKHLLPGACSEIAGKWTFEFILTLIFPLKY